MVRQRPRSGDIIDGDFTVKKHEMVVKKNEVSTEVKKKPSNLKAAMLFGAVGLTLFGATVGLDKIENKKEVAPSTELTTKNVKEKQKELETRELERANSEAERDKAGEKAMYDLFKTTDYSQTPGMVSEYVLTILEDNSVVISGQSGERTLLPGETTTYGATDITVEQVGKEQIKVLVDAHYESSVADKLEIHIDGIDKDDPYIGAKFAADITTANTSGESVLQMVPMVNESVALFNRNKTREQSHGIYNVTHDEDHKAFKTFVESLDFDDRIADITYGG